MSWMMETIKMNRAELLAVLWSVAVECQKLKWQKNRENALAADIVKGVTRVYIQIWMEEIFTSLATLAYLRTCHAKQGHHLESFMSYSRPLKR